MMAEEGLKDRIDQLEKLLDRHVDLAAQLQDKDDAIKALKAQEEDARKEARKERDRAAAAEARLKQVQDRSSGATPAPTQATAEPPARLLPAVPALYMTRERKLPKLRGPKQKSEDPDVEEWVADMENVISSRPMKPKEATEYILDHLVGEAKAEIRHRPTSVREDPKEMLAVIQEVFGDKRALSNRYEDFYRRQQSAQESLLDYSIALLKAWGRIEQDAKPEMKAGNKDQLLKDRLTEGVRDEPLKRELRRLNMELPDLTFWQFRERALKWLGAPEERMVMAAVKESVATPKSDPDAPTLMEMLKSQQEELAKLREEVRKLAMGRRGGYSGRARGQGRGRGGGPGQGRGYNDQGQRVCFNCASPHHFVYDCPQSQGGTGDVSSKKEEGTIPHPN